MKHDVRMTLSKGSFIDDRGRTRILRGCAISGDAKIPVEPNGLTNLPSSLTETKAVSFTGRPFPEEEADAHFLRLQSCGFTLLRWIITWEAVEHDGPEEYDENYLAYLRNLIKKAEDYGFYVILDPCMNAFSRWTGGCGAPAWVLEKLGIDLTKLDAAGAAYTHSAYLADQHLEDSYDWRINYRRYATQTLFTLFYGGHAYAPSMMIDGDPVQDYLQEHFINAMNHTARRLKDCDAIIGFSLPSNTSAGYIGTPDIRQFYGMPATKGIAAIPFEGMKAASGYEAVFTRITELEVPSVIRDVVFSGGEACGGIWKEGFECPWKTAGVWSVENGVPVVQKADYFATRKGEPIRFFEDFLKPFQEFFIETLQKKHSHYLFLTDDTVDGSGCDWTTDTSEAKEHIVQKFSLFEPSALLFRTDYDESLSTIDEAAASRKAGITPIVSSVPTSFTGRTGILKDIRKLLKQTGITITADKQNAHQEEVLNQLFSAFDEKLLSVVLWNYTAGNTAEYGDGWNGENNSIYDGDDKKLRAQKGYCWPYAIATQGRPVKMTFEPGENPVFTFEWDSAVCSVSSGDADTELYIPDVWFPNGWKVEKFDGVGQLREFREKQRLYIKTLEERRCSVRIVAL